jgi:glycosyltransferase involved in cell wall biosynthesis
MANYLLVHQNFPGQFPHLARQLLDLGHRVVAMGEGQRVLQRGKVHPALELLAYPNPQGPGRQTHPYLRGLEGHVRRGQAVFRATQQVTTAGFKPDVVLAHPGWGEALFLRDAFPRARHVQYLEFFYRSEGADVNFDPEFPSTVDDAARVRVKNATQLISFDAADAGISPTAWQKSCYPKDWQPRIEQLHEGIDTDLVRPDPDAQITLGQGADQITLTRRDQVITYVARNLEPYRGFHKLMRALPAILEQHPKAQVLIVGGDDVSYGGLPKHASSFRALYTAQWPATLDRKRVHFLGRLAYADYLKVLQVSSLHLYLTYPFVLSWSLLEALSAGCQVLASDTAPVTEVIQEGFNGFLTSFHDVDALADKVAQLLASPDAAPLVRQRARQTVVDHYDLKTKCLPALVRYLTDW